MFEIAHKGTIFLDEIAELPKSAQVKLLRVIQEGEFDKIGRTEKINVDIRVLAATNKNLGNEVKEKRFREDLFYRLNVISIDIPPLKDRREDIELLLDHFLNYYTRRMNIDVPHLSKEINHTSKPLKLFSAFWANSAFIRFSKFYFDYIFHFFLQLLTLPY